jgi:hypothetical protein
MRLLIAHGSSSYREYEYFFDKKCWGAKDDFELLVTNIILVWELLLSSSGPKNFGRSRIFRFGIRLLVKEAAPVVGGGRPTCGSRDIWELRGHILSCLWFFSRIA